MNVAESMTAYSLICSVNWNGEHLIQPLFCVFLLEKETIIKDYIKFSSTFIPYAGIITLINHALHPLVDIKIDMAES